MSYQPTPSEAKRAAACKLLDYGEQFVLLRQGLLFDEDLELVERDAHEFISAMARLEDGAQSLKALACRLRDEA
jgi:hypothetical protein